MSSSQSLLNRRLFFASAASASIIPFWTVKGAFAEELTKTPAQTEGPFYPNKLPLDTDNDLLIINDAITPAIGEIAHLSGKILDAKGNPVKNAVVEIWQCDANGVYLHTADSDKKKDTQDKNFQGFGRFVTASSGEYYFRTIKPVPYPGRTPHIHFKIKQGRKELLTTQLYVKAEGARNQKDFIYTGVKNDKQRESITVEFEKVKDSKINELAANFTIVLGTTPEG
jgi:protocatechuate 3,4-dioxygenase beta subunit